MELAERFKANGVDMTVVTRNVGNELRSSDPNAADIDLTRDLGYVRSTETCAAAEIGTF
jgi:hypothetical protein